MCATDWNHELFETPNGPEIYKSIKALKADRECWRECGIVQVEIDAKLIRYARREKMP
jgi:hypothetical protein